MSMQEEGEKHACITNVWNLVSLKVHVNMRSKSNCLLL